MVNKNTDENQYTEFYIREMKKTPIITAPIIRHLYVLKMMGSGTSVTAQEKNLEFTIDLEFTVDDSRKISVRYLPEQQISVRIN